MTPNITFYDVEAAARFQQVARLVDAAWTRGRKLLVYSDTLEETQALNEYLWTFQDASFIPHEVLSPGQKPKDQDCRIALVHAEDDPIDAEVLVMLTPTSVEFAARHAFVIDIVDHRTAESLAASRERFRLWREQGIQPKFKKP